MTLCSDETAADTHLFFLDNDIFVLLAGSGVLAEVVSCLGFTYPQCRCLATLSWMLGKGVFDISRDAAGRALAVCRQIPTLEGRAPEDALYDKLLSVKKIDPGEAQLIARALQGKHWLASGDKEWMKALCREPTLKQIRQDLCGRVLCLEALLELLLARRGREGLVRAFAPLHASHTTLRVILGSNDDHNFQEALAYHLAELEGFVGPGFLWRASSFCKK